MSDECLVNPSLSSVSDSYPTKRAVSRRITCLTRRCAIYVRAKLLSDVPGDLSRQVNSCEAYLREMGWEFIVICVDFGPPNKPGRLLGGFRSLLEEAAQGCFDTLLVHDKSHI